MTAVAELTIHSARPPRRALSARKLEHMLDWAEPTIRRTCQDVWRETWPRGMELEDLLQEGRIAVFLSADQISTARRPQALVATIVRRQAYDAVRVLADRSGFRHPFPTMQTTDAEQDGEDDDAQGRQAPPTASQSSCLSCLRLAVAAPQSGSEGAADE